jgi:hypothetical protein
MLSILRKGSAVVLFYAIMISLTSMFFCCQASLDASKPQTEASKPNSEMNAKESNPTKDSQITAPVVQEDVKESQAEGEERLPVYPYDRLRTSSTNPPTDIDVTKREVNPAVLTIPLPNYVNTQPLTLLYWHLADISVFIRVQRKVWNDKGGFCEATKMEAE